MGRREVTCPKCGGIGKLICWRCEGKGGWWTVFAGDPYWEKCGICWGNGKKDCDGGCNGWGKITVWD